MVALLTPYYKEGGTVLVLRPRDVLLHNAARWLLLDVLTAFPLAWTLRTADPAYATASVTLAPGQSPSMLSLLRMLQSLRVLRAARTYTSIRATACFATGRVPTTKPSPSCAGRRFARRMRAVRSSRLRT